MGVDPPPEERYIFCMTKKRGRPATGHDPVVPLRLDPLTWETLNQLYGRGRGRVVRALINAHLGQGDPPEAPCATCVERAQRRAQAKKQ